ncbi:hypothetical protein L7F22_055358 [Adiantum nelumboides]|nr:hypothetical protein [Adiantum nelumboides]
MASRTGKSDPYAVLTCGNAPKQQSKVLQDAGGNPVWNETFTMELKGGDNPPELLVSIFDKEKKGKDEPMGTVRVPLATVYTQKQVPPTKYKVQLASGKFHGEIEIRLKFSPKQTRKGTLQVKLAEGRDLVSSDIASKNECKNPFYCSNHNVNCCNRADNWLHEWKCETDAGANPVWNETFVFETSGNANELEVDLFDKDTFSKDDPLGKAKISLDKVFSTNQVAPTPYQVLGKAGQPQGNIVIGLNFTPKA